MNVTQHIRMGSDSESERTKGIGQMRFGQYLLILLFRYRNTTISIIHKMRNIEICALILYVFQLHALPSIRSDPVRYVSRALHETYKYSPRTMVLLAKKN